MGTSFKVKETAQKLQTLLKKGRNHGTKQFINLQLTGDLVRRRDDRDSLFSLYRYRGSIQEATFIKRIRIQRGEIVTG